MSFMVKINDSIHLRVNPQIKLVLRKVKTWMEE